MTIVEDVRKVVLVEMYNPLRKFDYKQQFNTILLKVGIGRKQQVKFIRIIRQFGSLLISIQGQYLKYYLSFAFQK